MSPLRTRIRELRRLLGVLVGTGWRAAPGLMTLSAVVGLVGSLSLIAYPVGFRYVVDGAIAHHRGEVLGGVVFAAAAFALGWTLRLTSAIQGSRLNDRCSLLMFGHIGRLVASAPYLEHFEDPARMADVEALRDNRRVVATAPRQALSLAQQAVQVLGVVVLLALVYPPVLVVPLLAVVPGWAARRAARIEKASEDDLAEDRNLLGELFRLVTAASSARELRTFGASAALLERHAALGDAINRRARRAARRAAAYEGVGWLVYAAGFVAAIVVLVLRAAHGHTSPGAVVQAVSLLRRAQGQVSGVTDSTGNYATAIRTARRLLRFEDYVDAASAGPSRSLLVPGRLQTGITLEGVSFSYPDAPTPDTPTLNTPAPNTPAGAPAAALTDVDLHLPAGATVAVVGENGAGKSTLVKLLTGMYRPSSGRILVDGTDLAELRPADWRLATTATFQDHVAFQMMLREGVGIGDLTRLDDLDRVGAALGEADAEGVVASLPDGVDTLLGPYVGGQQLSGGQWQRLALARGLMRETPLLVVLDEPTASLDAPTEAALFDRYRHAARRLGVTNGAVTVLVSHRFSTVHMADLIVVLEAGRIREVGDHASLMAAGGLYAELFDLQARAYLGSL